MVSGRFCYTSDPVRSEDASYELQDIVCAEPQNGTGSYARNDFNPGVADERLSRAAAPVERVPGSRRSNGTGCRLQRTVVAAHVRKGDDDSRRRPLVELLGSPRRPHRPGHRDCRNPAGVARRPSAGQRQSTGRDAVCARGHVHPGPQPGRADHDQRDRQPRHRRHHTSSSSRGALRRRFGGRPFCRQRERE